MRGEPIRPPNTICDQTFERSASFYTRNASGATYLQTVYSVGSMNGA